VLVDCVVVSRVKELDTDVVKELLVILVFKFPEVAVNAVLVVPSATYNDEAVSKL
jgi:hypothetical protein